MHPRALLALLIPSITDTSGRLPLHVREDYASGWIVLFTVTASTIVTKQLSLDNSWLVFGRCEVNYALRKLELKFVSVEFRRSNSEKLLR